MALPPGAVRATEPKPLRRNGGVDVSRVALLGRDPDVIADVARVPRMNLCNVTTHVHRAEHGRVTERERIFLGARRGCSDKRHRGNSGDRKETAQLFSLRGISETSPRYPRCEVQRKRYRVLVCRLTVRADQDSDFEGSVASRSALLSTRLHVAHEFVDGVLVGLKIEISTIASPWTR